MAPEMINIDGYNYVLNQKSNKFFFSSGYNGVQTDVFAIGVIMFSLLMGRPPFKIADINDPFYRMLFTQQFAEFWAPWDHFAMQNGYEIPEDFKQLFVSLVTHSPLMRLSINEILSSRWMSRNIPLKEDVVKYMQEIKDQIDEENSVQKAPSTELVKSKATIEEQKDEVDDLNDSSLSGLSQMKDDDELIMKDLQDIESEFQDGNSLDGSHAFDLDDAEEFDVGEMMNSSEFDDPQNEEIDYTTPTEASKPGKELKDTHEEQADTQGRTSAIIQYLDNLEEINTEVRTSVPEKVLSFLEQYSKLKDWKMAKISNYILLKIPESSTRIVEFAMKIDLEEDGRYTLKYLKYDEMSLEEFHSVGSFILNLLSPYC